MPNLFRAIKRRVIRVVEMQFGGRANYQSAVNEQWIISMYLAIRNPTRGHGTFVATRVWRGGEKLARFPILLYARAPGNFADNSPP